MTAWAVQVAERDGTPVGTVEASSVAADAAILRCSGREEKNDVGAGVLTVPFTFAHYDWFTDKRVVHLYVRGGGVTQFLLDPPDLTLFSRNGPGGRVAEFKLRHVNGVLSEGVVTPPGGSDVEPYGDDVIFDSSHPQYGPDTSAATWNAPQEFGTLTWANANWPLTPFGTGIPDSTWGTVKVVGPTGITDITADAPGGAWFLRRVVTFPATGWYHFAVSGDDITEARLDGRTICPRNQSMGNASTAKVYVTAGDHVWWICVENAGPAGGTGVGPTAVAYHIGALDSADNLSSTLAYSNGTSDSICEFPSSPPGFYLGALLRVVLAENQARGTLTDLTANFTSLADSNEVAWSEEYAIATKARYSLSDFVHRELCEARIDSRVRWAPSVGLVWDVVHKGGFARDKTAITFDGSNLDELVIHQAKVEATSFWARWNNGGREVVTLVNITPAAGYPRKEAGVDFGAIHNREEAVATATDQLGKFGVTRSMGQLHQLVDPNTPDAVCPGSGWWVFDTIAVPFNEAGTTASVEVIAMSFDLGQTLEFVAECGDFVVPLNLRADLAAKMLRKVAPLNGGGEVRPAQPSSPQVNVSTSPNIA